MIYFTFSRHSQFDVKWAQHWSPDPRFLAPHSNPHFELIIVTDGTIFLQIEQSKFELHQGDILLLTPWEQHHGWKLDYASGFFWVQFSVNPQPGILPSWNNSMWDIENVQAKQNDLRTFTANDADGLVIPRHLGVKPRYRFNHIFEQLIAEFEHPKVYFRFRASLLLSKLLEMIACSFLEDQNFDMNLPASYNTYRRMVDYLHENYHSDHNLSKHAIESAMERNYDYLSQLFKKYSGINVVNYLHQLRVQRAQYLLERTDKSITEITAEIGLHDPFYFSKLFKKMVGMPPTEYKKNFYRSNSGSSTAF